MICAANTRQPGHTPCRVRGEHAQHCDGFARMISAGQTVILDDACEGCLPRPAEVGAFCEFHATQATDALGRAGALILRLWALNDGGVRDDNDRVAGGFGSRWTLTESHIAADELVRVLRDAAAAHARARDVLLNIEPAITLGGIHSGADGDAVIWGVRGLLAEFEHPLPAWRFGSVAHAFLDVIRAVRSALHRFPMEDKTHAVPVMRCRECNRLALEWHPPAYYLGPDEIKCSRCGAIEPRALLEHDMRVILAAGRKKR